MDIEDLKIDISLKAEKIPRREGSIEEEIVREILKAVDRVDDLNVLLQLKQYVDVVDKTAAMKMKALEEKKKIDESLNAIISLLNAINTYIEVLEAKKKAVDEAIVLARKTLYEVRDKIKRLKESREG